MKKHTLAFGAVAIVAGLISGIWMIPRAPAATEAGQTPLERRVAVIEATRAGLENADRSTSFDVLERALNDKQLIVRSAALRGLGTIGGQGEQVLARTVMEHDDFQTRHLAMAELRELDALDFDHVASQMSGRLAVSATAHHGEDADRSIDDVLPAVLLEHWRFMTGTAGGAFFFALFSPDFENEQYVANALEARGELRLIDMGPFGKAIEMSPDPSNPRQQTAFRLPRSLPMLSPEGDFTIELWLRPSTALAERRSAQLLDKMGSGRVGTDYSMRLQREGDDAHRVRISLGFREHEDDEDAVVGYQSEPVTWTAKRWHHLAFSYDGAGTGRIYLDGQIIGEQRHAGRGSIVPGNAHLSIGDRTVANHGGFPGDIGGVRIHHEQIEVTHVDFED